MRECEHKGSLCQCVDWKKDDIDVLIHHMVSNFEFTGFELEYTTLEPEEGRRLCKVGRCRACGKRLCTGDELPAQATPDDLLAEIFRRAFQLWNADSECLPDGAATFTDLFLSLFHEADRDYVGRWLLRLAKDVRQNIVGEGS